MDDRVGLGDQTATFHQVFPPLWSAFADRTAVVASGRTHTFAEHRDRVYRLCDALRNRARLTRSGRFGVLALNSAEYLELYHAAYLGAGVVNPLNIRLAAEELAFILRDSATEIAFVDAAFAPVIAGVRAAVPSLRLVVGIGGNVEGAGIDERFDDLLAGGACVPPAPTDAGDPVCLMYTGGTTGLPKGVVHTQRSQVATVSAARPLLDLGPDDVFLAATPLFHAASSGAFTQAPARGCAVALLPAFTPAGFMGLAEATAATTTVLVPTMVRMLLDDPAFRPERLASMRALLYGGSPMPAGVLARLAAALPDLDVIQAYGMTEGLPVSMLDAADHRAGGPRLASAGRAVAGVAVSIRDPDGIEVAPGETGEICVQAQMLAERYWNRTGETEAAWSGGCYHTGDVGYVDEGGYVFLVDRAKDMIVTGGENVYSSEVESALSTHHAVADVAVIGIPSDEWGEAVHAVVVLRAGATVTSDELVAHARARIAGYKIPRSFELRTDPLPVSGAGKTLKRALRQPYWEGRGRSVG